ncbi:MAG: alanine racemase [Sandarakinorhabdus sp.]|nr:alanine racemase [Sandarakinorhabdus sp.]
MQSPPNAHLIVDTAALADNWRVFAAASGPADCGAAVKADGYGLGARAVADALVAAGCRDLFVAHWHEVAALESLPAGVRINVLHGVAAAEMPAALASRAVPVLVTAAQVAAWKPTGRPCDVMVDTGLNRLGLSLAEAVSGLLDGLALDTLHSHLACGEIPGHPLNETQRAAFADLAARIPARRHALANSGGLTLGDGYRFSLSRPGIGLYGGGAAPAGARLLPVAGLAARIVQCRDVAAGATIGYGATYTAARPMRIAIAALGYADGYPRSLSNAGAALVGGKVCPGVGRISMDLSAYDVTDVDPRAVEEDSFLTIDFDLARTAAASGRTEYELLTGLGARYARIYR